MSRYIASRKHARLAAYVLRLILPLAELILAVPGILLKLLILKTRLKWEKHRFRRALSRTAPSMPETLRRELEEEYAALLSMLDPLRILLSTQSILSSQKLGLTAKSVKARRGATNAG